MPAKIKLLGRVGLDFFGADDIRSFSFLLCEFRPTGLMTIAIVWLDDDSIRETRMTKAIAHRKNGIERLARIYHRRSIPQRFHTKLCNE